MIDEAASTTAGARAELRVEVDLATLVLSGEWELAESHPSAEELLEPLRNATRRAPALRKLSFDAQALEEWDSSLLIFLMQCQAFADEQKISLDTSGLPEQVPRLLALANAVPERVQPPEAKRLTWVARIGTAAIGFWDDLLASITFTGDVAISLVGLATRRVHMRWREFWVVVQRNGSGALPIVTLIALLMGVIVAFLGVVVLKRFGAGYYVSYLVGFGILRELGALMTGIIIAGRTGAAFAAELGSMKITEEIDAYTTLGISSVDHLVLPRVIGLFVMMPLLTIYADLVGIAGGMLVSSTMLDLSLKQFMNGLLSAVTISDAMLGIVKSTLFGAIVGIAGSMKGLQAGSDASAVGEAATSAVVLGITFIIVANALVDWLAALLNL